MDRSPACSAAKPWVNSQEMGSALKGRRKAGGIAAPARVSAVPPRWTSNDLSVTG